MAAEEPEKMTVAAAESPAVPSSVPSVTATATEASPSPPPAPCPNFPRCDGKGLARGCDGQGRIQGGIGAIPLFSWWPIKVYRPCPSFLAAGYQYRRAGQSWDEIVYGADSPGNSFVRDQ
ncbi:unnamed protein product [Vitrella brassicaformis CCMP3155]|uniref:Uncharacterized protein n=2 Tax=Vitrella brassicaformis TaxID=1169539 RepID=A0A0G4EYN2_VITBC|nr:unnamed protein product [Vitrella brassicaformis CCMP3155]|eukprot:CEM04168.1 unnamed protein product [Vitrella brassicaformis CCMP3155]